MLTRMYHVSCLANNFKKQGIKLSKMLNPKGKRRWYDETSKSDTMPTVKSLAKVKNEPAKRAVRRLAVLNKLFMKNITDLMSTGTAAMDIVGSGIEITKVNLMTDLDAVHVYWVCKGKSSDADIETLFNKTAGLLRHELSTLRVMGEVPHIVFVKDKQEAQLVELDRRLAIADYGEDYTPTDLGHLLKSEFTMDTTLSPEMKAKIKQLEEQEVFIEDPLPEMTHNIFGLDHAKIMNRLLAARKRSRDAWANLDSVDTAVISYRAPANAVGNEDTVNQKQELADFLLKRQIEQKKLKQQWRRDNSILAVDDDDEGTPHDEEEYDDELSDEEYSYRSEDTYCYGEKSLNLRPKLKSVD